MAEWERKVRENVAEAAEHGQTALRDAIPSFLDQLFATLGTEVSKEKVENATADTAVEHGEQRAELGNYSVEAVVMEYEILRQVLVAILEVREPVRNHEREAIISAIFAAVRKSVAEFAALENQKRALFETSLQSQLKSLQEERELRENFVSILSHDLRTPLTAARMSAQLLLRQRENPGSLEKLTGRIIDNLDRADDMIRNLLDANRIKAGETLPITVEPCVANRIIREALDNLTTIYGNRFVFEESSNIDGYWDPDALRRVIENLCGNAVKYGSDREITVALRELKNEVEIQISVHNWGAPIPSEELEELFQHFRRRKSEGTEGHRGWGIGLTLVRGIAEAHGGKAFAESSENAGTTFNVRLPRDARRQ